LTEIKKIKTN